MSWHDLPLRDLCGWALAAFCIVAILLLLISAVIDITHARRIERMAREQRRRHGEATKGGGL